MFQALTGCQDRERALFFLKGAGDDLSIAVNHFLTALEQAELSNPSSPSESVAAGNAVDSASTKKTTHENQSQERSQEKSQSRSEDDSSAPSSVLAAASASSPSKDNDSNALIDDSSVVDDMVVDAGAGGGADVMECSGEDRGGAAVAHGVSGSV